MAEIESGVMHYQALTKPHPDIESFKGQIRILTIKQNEGCNKINCQLKIINVNIKLTILYTTIL